MTTAQQVCEEYSQQHCKSLGITQIKHDKGMDVLSHSTAVNIETAEG
jgi:hypothetical protein